MGLMTCEACNFSEATVLDLRVASRTVHLCGSCAGRRPRLKILLDEQPKEEVE
jgi:hypothetical protein